MRIMIRVTCLLVIFAAVAVAAPPPLDHTTRDYDQRHLRLDITRLDIRKGLIEATATLDLRPNKLPGLHEVRLHAVRLKVASVTMGEKTLPHRAEGGLLVIKLPRTYTPKEQLRLVIRYSASPRRGLYFFKPDKAYPKRPLQVWSQGEATDNRHWIPCYDLPDDRLTSELLVTPPAGFEVISNGVLAGKPGAEGKAWHWKQERAHVSYLITLVVGEFETLSETTEGLEIRSLYPPGRRAEAVNAFKRTGAMMAQFNRQFGRYPWPSYRQIVVHDFMYGGMENTGATTLNHRALHDQRASLDYSADGLVSHELAHQWFGNLVTCRTFAHIWLNEGFATYLEHLWFEKLHGRDWAEYRRHRSLRSVIARSSVPKKFKFARGTPAGLRGGAAYGRGAAMLHLLRTELGDAAFFKALMHYAKKCADRSVQTEDLRKAIEESSGRDLGRLFDDWIYHPGVPTLRIFWLYSKKRDSVMVGVTQLQKHRMYHMKLPVILYGPDARATKTLEITKRDHLFFFPMKTVVTDLLVDPQANLPIKIENAHRGEADWLRLTDESELHLVRLKATEALARHPAAGAPRLIRLLKNEKHWQIRAAAARSLANIDKDDSVVDALIAALGDEQSRVRREAAQSLGKLKAKRATDALRKTMQADRSYWAQGAAAKALAGIKPEGLFDELSALLPQPSYHDNLKVALLEAMVILEDPRALDIATRLARYEAGNRRRVRLSAIGCIDRLRGNDDELRKRLIEFLADPDYKIRRQLLGMVREGKIAGAKEAVKRVASSDPHPAIKRQAQRVLKKLENKPPPGGNK